jgi:hypothetical protein
MRRLELNEQATGPLILIGCLVIVSTLVQMIVFKDFWGELYLTGVFSLLTFAVIWMTSGVSTHMPTTPKETEK